MSKLFCFAFLLVACLAAFASAQSTPFTRQLICKDYTTCLCVSVPRMIDAANGRKATATLTNPTTGQKEVIDLSQPMSDELKARCAAAAAAATTTSQAPRRH